MIIGILEADDLPEDVIQRYGRYATAFEHLLTDVDPQLSFKTYHVTRQKFPQHTDDCDVYIVTGSKFSCYEDFPWIHRLKQFVVDCLEHEKKLIGICFGHQLIAQALGGAVQQHDKGWGIGLACSEVIYAPKWLSPKQNTFNLLVSHHDQVTRLPNDASLIATNEFCPIFGYQVNHTILTFQGHPEFNRDYVQYIMDKCREDIGEQTYHQAKASMLQSVDHDVVAKWIVNFINS